MSKDKTKTKQKKKMSVRKKVVIVSVVLAMAIAASFYFFGCMDTGNFDSTLSPELSEYSGTIKPAPTDGSTPADHTPNDNYYYALHVLKNAGAFTGESRGSAVSLGVSQSIKASRVVSGGEVYKLSVSHSVFKQGGVRMYVNGDNYVLQDSASVGSVDDVSWKDSARRVTKETFLDMFGAVPDGIFAYVLTDDTILSGEYLGRGEDGLHGFRYVLDNLTATARIRLEMRTMSGADTLPNFSRVCISVYLDDGWRVMRTTTDNVYKVHMAPLGVVECRESLTEVFDYSPSPVIPDAEFFRGYLDSETVEPEPEPERDAMYYLMNGFGALASGEQTDLAFELSGAVTASGSVSAKADISAIVAALGGGEFDLGSITGAISAYANVNLLTVAGATLNDVTLGFDDGTVYLGYGDLKAKATIDEIRALIARFAHAATLSAAGAGDPTEALGAIISGAALTRGDGRATVTLDLAPVLGSGSASLEFTESDGVAFDSLTADLGGVHIGLSAHGGRRVTIDKPAYMSVVGLADIIDENGDIELNAAVDSEKSDLGADICFNLNDKKLKLATELYGLPIRAMLDGGTVYVSAAGLNVYAATEKLGELLTFLAPVIGDVNLDLGSALPEIDIAELLNSLTATTDDDVLTLSFAVGELNGSIDLNISGGVYSLSAVRLTVSGANITLSPAETKADFSELTDTDSFVDFTAVRDLIGDNGDINLTATIAEHEIALTFNIFDLKLGASAFGALATLDLSEGMAYVSYGNINAHLAIADLAPALDALTPILTAAGVNLPSLDLGSMDGISIEDILGSIKTTKGDGSLTLSVSINGILAEVLFDVSGGALDPLSVTITIGETVITAVPSPTTVPFITKAENSVDLAALVNAVSGLVSKNGDIELNAAVDSEKSDLGADICFNLNDKKLKLATELYGLPIKAMLDGGTVYVSAAGLNVYAATEEIGELLTFLAPVIGDVNLDLGSALPEIDIAELLNSLTATTDDDVLTLSFAVGELNGSIDLSVSGGAYSLGAVRLTVSGANITLSPAETKADFSELTDTDAFVDFTAVRDLIGDNGDIDLTASVAEHEIALTFNIFDLKLGASAFGALATLDLSEGMAYVSYGNINAHLAIADLAPALDALTPILTAAGVNLPSLDLGSMDGISIEDILGSIKTTKGDGSLTLSVSINGILAEVLFDVSGGALDPLSVTITIGETVITAVPSPTTVPFITKAENSVDLAALVNAVSGLVSKNGDIELNATVDSEKLNLGADICFNLNDKKLKLATELYGLPIKAMLDGGTVCVSAAGLNVYAATEKLGELLTFLAPVIGDVNLDLGSALPEINVAELLNSLATSIDGNVLTLSFAVGELNGSIDLNISGGAYSLGAVRLTVGGANITLSPAETKADFSELTDTDAFVDFTAVRNLIGDNGDINLTATIAEHEIALTFNIFDLKLGASAFDALATLDLSEGMAYVSYGNINAHLAIADLAPALDALTPILTAAGVNLPSLDLGSMDGIAIEDILGSIKTTKGDCTLTLSVSINGVLAEVLFDVSGGALDPLSVTITIGETVITAVPSVTTVPFITKAENSVDLAALVNAVTGLVSENEDIELKAAVDSEKLNLGADICFNLNDKKLKLATELYGLPIKAMLDGGTVYVSAAGLNVYAATEEIGELLAFLAPVIGDVNLDLGSALPEIDIAELLNSLTATTADNVLTLSFAAGELNGSIDLNIGGGVYSLSAVRLTVDGANITLSPAETKADFSELTDTDSFVDFTAVRSLIGDNGDIDLTASVAEHEIALTFNIFDLKLGASAFGALATLDLSEGMAYVSYGNINAHLAIADLAPALDALTPILTAAGVNLPSLDLGGMDGIAIEDILGSIKTTKGDGTLTLSVSINGVLAEVLFDVSGGALDPLSVTVTIGETTITAVPSVTTIPFITRAENSVDLKAFVDAFASPIAELLGADDLALAVTGGAVKGGTVYEITSGAITVGSYRTAANVGADLTVHATTRDETGAVTAEKDHVIKLRFDSATKKGYVYYNGVEGTFEAVKFDDTLAYLAEIRDNIPELDDLLSGGSSSEPIDIKKIIRGLTFADGKLTATLDLTSISASLPESLSVVLSVTDEGLLAVSVGDLSLGGLTIDAGAVASPIAPEEAEEALAYTPEETASDFSSINELLHGLAVTSAYRNFSLAAKLNLSIATLAPVDLSVDIEVDGRDVYVNANIVRPHSVLWDDYEGSATLYYDGSAGMIYIHDLSYEKKTFLFIPSKGKLRETRLSYTVDEFKADAMNIILTRLLHLDTSSMEGLAGSGGMLTLENAFRSYSYDAGAGRFTVVIDLSELSKALGEVTLTIDHDADYNLSALGCSLKLAKILNVSLSATHKAPFNAPNGAKQAVLDAVASGLFPAASA